MLPLVPAIGFGWCNYQLDTKFRGVDKLYMMLSYSFVVFFGSLAGIIMTYGFYSQRLISLDAIVSYAIFGIVWYISDYTYFILVEEGYSIIATSLSLGLIPVMIIIIRLIKNPRAIMLSEILLAIAIVGVALILGYADNIDKWWGSTKR